MCLRSIPGKYQFVSFMFEAGVTMLNYQQVIELHKKLNSASSST